MLREARWFLRCYRNDEEEMYVAPIGGMRASLLMISTLDCTIILTGHFRTPSFWAQYTLSSPPHARLKKTFSHPSVVCAEVHTAFVKAVNDSEYSQPWIIMKCGIVSTYSHQDRSNRSISVNGLALIDRVFIQWVTYQASLGVGDNWQDMGEGGENDEIRGVFGS